MTRREPLRVSVPDASFLDRLAGLDERVELEVWDFAGPQPEGRLDMALRPYVTGTDDLRRIDPARVRAIQSQSLGYNDVESALPPGVTFCNAVGVHEDSTAELAMGLILASQRGIDHFARAHLTGEWLQGQYSSLLDSRVLLVGYGGIGKALTPRLAGFGVEVVRVARSARTDEHGQVYAITELEALLPGCDVVVIAVPFDDSTKHLVDDAFLAAMQPGALLVNVARGGVADTEALVRHASSGHVRLALDVVDPEPLPPDHALWGLPGVLIAPHVGGNTRAMRPRVDEMIRSQVARLLEGRGLAHVVIPTPTI